MSEFDHVVCHGVVFDRAFDQALEYETDFRAGSPVASETELVQVLLSVFRADAALTRAEPRFASRSFDGRTRGE